MITLRMYVDSETKVSGLQAKEVKEEIAEVLQIGISTLYLWLKSGNYYIEELGATIAGDDNGIIVWKMEKTLF